jgi:hypothetical protein
MLYILQHGRLLAYKMQQYAKLAELVQTCFCGIASREYEDMDGALNFHMTMVES